MKKPKIFKGLAAFALTTAAFAFSAWTGPIRADAYELESHTQQEIKQKFEELYFDLHDIPEYTEDYSTSSPCSAGNISDSTVQSALNSVNFVRYIAGLPSNVGIKDEYNVLAQHASLVNFMNGRISHTPVQPEGLEDDLYSLGYKGAGSSNIGMGYVSIVSSVISGYMEDTDTSNISALGHRRWILNPDMQYTGFGMVGNSTAMYAHDTSAPEDFTGDYICWPANNTPYELVDTGSYGYDSSGNLIPYGYAYSVTLGNSYDTPDISKVTVDVTSEKLDKTWHLDSSCNEMTNYLNVNNGGYGMPKCIIFNVGVLPEDDSVTVTVKGITQKGVEKPITYTVNYFNLIDDSKYSVGFEKSSYNIAVGETATLRFYGHPLKTIKDKVMWRMGDNIDISINEDMVTVTGKTKGTSYLWIGDSTTYYEDTKIALNVTDTHVHTSSDWITDKEASAGSTGKRHKECLVCGETLETETIPALQTDLSKCTVSLSASTYTYDGTAKKPSVTVKNGTTVLTAGTDYTVSYSNNINAGTAKVTLTGKGSCTGTVSKTFKISPKAVSSCNITLSSDSRFFTGKRVKPTVTVKIGGVTVATSNYTAVYSDNLSVGTGKITITGKNNLSGSTVKTFAIVQRSVANCDISLAYTSSYFSGVRKKPAVTVKIDDTTLYSGNYTLSYVNNLSAGTATVTITGKNNLKGTAVRSFSILPRSIKNCTVTLKKDPSSPKNPDVTVAVGDKILYSGNYTVTYSAVSGGKVKVTVTGKNNLKDSVTLSYTVS